MSKPTLFSVEEVQRRIHSVRGHRVMLAADLANFYGVTTFNLNKAVSRNFERFPEDFAFYLTRDESRNLIFQFGISSPEAADAKRVPAIERTHGGTRKPPRVFTEQGVAMLASVLHSPRAVAVSVAIIRAFVQLRELLSSQRELAAKFAELERKLEGHDTAIANLFEAIRQLLAPPGPDHDRKIGFHPGNR